MRIAFDDVCFFVKTLDCFVVLRVHRVVDSVEFLAINALKLELELVDHPLAFEVRQPLFDIALLKQKLGKYVAKHVSPFSGLNVKCAFSVFPSILAVLILALVKIGSSFVGGPRLHGFGLNNAQLAFRTLYNAFVDI
jgi:hypothetical protein